MIYHNFENFIEWKESQNCLNFKPEVYMTSGGFDPMHIGHLRCIQETVAFSRDIEKYTPPNFPIVCILVNDDEFLIKKKGYAFMPLHERMEIVQAIAPSAHIVPWMQIGEDSTVVEAIRKVKPNYFMKGGDRFDASTIPEWYICQELNCSIITGVGGKKIQSSSDLVKKSKGSIL